MNFKKAAIVGGLFLATGYYVMTTPKNVRNNNPLNIERGADWDGLAVIPQDIRFATFSSPEFGFRAGYVTLIQYLKRGDNTIEKIINKWAPDHENDSNGYAAFVANKMGVDVDFEVTPDDLTVLMFFMAQMEGANGKHEYELATVVRGAELAQEREDIAQYVDSYGSLWEWVS